MKKPTHIRSKSDGSYGPEINHSSDLFEQYKEYNLKDLIDSDLHRNTLVRILFHRAKCNSSTMPLLKEWCRRCIELQRIKTKEPNTPSECEEVLRSCMKAWATGKPTSKGARQWTQSVLLEIINEGKF